MGTLKYSGQKWSNAAFGRGQHTFSFLIHTPKNVTSERPIALVPSLVRRWKWLIQELKQRTRKKNGTLQKDAMAEHIERRGKLCWRRERNFNVEDMDQGAVTLVLDFSKALRKVHIKVMWASAMHLGFPQRILRVRCGYFQHQEGCSWKDVWTRSRLSHLSYQAQIG